MVYVIMLYNESEIYYSETAAEAYLFAVNYLRNEFKTHEATEEEAKELVSGLLMELAESYKENSSNFLIDNVLRIIATYRV